MGESRSKFTALEVCRGVAAVMVVFHHAGNIIAEPRFYGTTVVGGHLSHFHVGVDFFFVLSGFIIAWVHWSDVGKPDRLRTYAMRRFLRIYPPYWSVLLPLTALYFLVPNAGAAPQHDLANLFFSFTLLPYPLPPIIGVAWTLVHEVIFYCLFGLVIALGRPALWLLPLWGIAILAAQGAHIVDFPASVFLSPYNLEFLLGVMIAALLHSRQVLCPGLIAAAGAFGFGALTWNAGYLLESSLVFRGAFGLSAALLIVGLVGLEREGRVRLPRALVFLGSASYTIYLIHGVIVVATIHVLVRTISFLPAWAVLPFLVVTATLAGCAYRRVVEVPLSELLGSHLGTRRSKSSPMKETSIVSGSLHPAPPD